MGARVAGHVAWREIGGETFVVDLKSKRMFGFNPVGARVWQAVVDGEGPRHAEQADVAAFLDELSELGLVEGHEPSSELTASPPGFVPPRVEWREELRSFGFSCALLEGQSPVCDQIPVE